MLRSQAIGTILIPLIHTLNSGFRTRVVLLVEILALRHQLGVLKPSTKKRPRLGKSDRFFWVGLCRWWPDWRNSLLIVKPETVLAWHQRGFRLY
jgi:putative transposase